jgi:O-antigen biosynthesis protein
VRVAFLLKDLQLSGGVGVALTHARNLAAEGGFDVSIVTTAAKVDPDWEYDALPHVHVITLNEALGQEFDIAISTWWETAYSLFLLRAKRYASFVQSIEDRFYQPHESIERLSARLTLDLPVAFITEASWIAETLAELRPDASIQLVRNGIDKEVFAPVETIEPNSDRPLRVLIEGSPQSWFKGLRPAIKAADRMKEEKRLTIVCSTLEGLEPTYAPRVVGPLSQPDLVKIYSDTDVLLKLSRVEGMYGPPLEGFHRGATCITTEVTGSDEYIRHGVNALICDWDDPRGTAAQLDLLARDRELLARLRRGALETARQWPDWSQSSREFAAALAEIAASPRPDGIDFLPGMLQRLRVGIEKERGSRGYYRLLAADAGRWRRINSVPGLSQLFAARRSLKRHSPTPNFTRGQNDD